jgi:hypothetical protein
VLKDLKKPDKRAVIKFHKRGWTQDSTYKLEGAVFSDKDNCVYTFEGKWNDSIVLTECATGDQEVVW